MRKGFQIMLHFIGCSQFQVVLFKLEVTNTVYCLKMEIVISTVNVEFSSGKFLFTLQPFLEAEGEHIPNFKLFQRCIPNF